MAKKARINLDHINLKGWRPDRNPEDPADPKYFASPAAKFAAAAADFVDLVPQAGPVLNQLDLGSCTANMGSGMHQFKQKQQGFTENWVGSRLKLYRDTREIERTIDQDSGASIRDTMKAAVTQGLCPEKMWPYDVRKFTQRPPDECYQEAVKYVVTEYARVQQNADEIEACIASDGLDDPSNPVGLGILVYSGLMSDATAKTGMVPMPSALERRRGAQGGHAIYLLGYDRKKGLFKFRNSWSEQWGDNGCGYFRYEYILDPNITSDLWIMKTIKNPNPAPTPTPPQPPTPPTPTPITGDWKTIWIGTQQFQVPKDTVIRM